MSPATHTPEHFSHSLARRVLTQEMPLQVLSRGDAKKEVASLAPHVAPLSASFSVTPEAANDALRGHQFMLADDVRSLFPGDSSMDHVSAQIETKADGQVAAPHLPRER